MDVRTMFDVGPEGFTVPVGAPSRFVPHAYRRSFVAPFGIEQVWPFRVEFVDGGFEPGVLNVHHGPFLNVAGVIGEVRDPQPGVTAYRDLKYFYGSYAISPRLVRPTRLQFWAEETVLEGGGTLLTLRLDSLVRRPFAPLWKHSQRVFWSRFPVWIKKELLP